MKIRFSGKKLALLMALVLVAAVGETVQAETSFSGCVQNGKLIPGSIRTDGPANCRGKQVEVNWSSTHTVAGIVGKDGDAVVGSGYTVSKLDVGHYRIDFPAGTWSSFPVVTASPFGIPGAFPAAVVGTIIGYGDGSAWFDIILSSTVGPLTPIDASFQFIAVSSLP